MFGRTLAGSGPSAAVRNPLQRVAPLAAVPRKGRSTKKLSGNVVKQAIAEPEKEAPVQQTPTPLETVDAMGIHELPPIYGGASPVASLEQMDVLMEKVKKSQAEFATFTQAQVDQIFKYVAMTANQERVPIAQLAVQETGRGIVEDKVIKNHFASEFVYNKYKNVKTCGVILDDKVQGITKIAEPVGPIMGIIPITNPTSTMIFKALMAIKTRNAIVFSPHPAAVKVCFYMSEVLRQAAVAAGAPANIISCIDSTDRATAAGAIKHPAISYILATGGPSVVKASYSSGKPAIGVGAGNAPALVDETADLNEAVASIVLSKTFDNGMICASENSAVVVESVYAEFQRLMIHRGCYFLSEDECKKVGKVVIKDGHINADVVGKSATHIAQLAGVKVPSDTLVLCGEGKEVGPGDPMAYEKLCPVLGLYTAKDFDAAVELCRQLVEFGGKGHSANIYTNPSNTDRIMKYETAIPADRVMLNTPSSFGAIGDVYNFRMAPSLTLGCGSQGGNSISENVGPMHLLNIKTMVQKRENMLWFKVPRAIYFKRGIMPFALQDLVAIRETEGHLRATIVTDKTMVRLGHVNKLLNELHAYDVVTDVYDGITPDPTFECIEEGVERFRQFSPNVVIAFGGGSPMDAAKIMRLMYEHPSVTIPDLTTRFMDIRKRVANFPNLGAKVKSLICVPTTSGTGAEITPFAVVTGPDGRKYPICDYVLTPDMAIVDPTYTDNMPKSLTSNTGYDALVHAIESYVSIVSTDYTKALSLQSIKMIHEHLGTAVHEPSNEEARNKMHNASAIAGMAFSNAFLGICHSMAHQLGALFHLPHGMANALVLSHVIKYNATDKPTKMGVFPQYKYPSAMREYGLIADFIGVTKPGMTPADKVNALIDSLEKLKRDVELPMSIKEAGVPEEVFMAQVDKLALMAFDDQCTGANPRYPLIAELRQLFIDAYKGRPNPVRHEP